MKSLVDSIDAALKSVVTGSHKGVRVVNPFTYLDHHGTEISIASGRVPGLFRDMKIWSLEKLEEVSILAKQQMYKVAEKQRGQPNRHHLI